MCPIKCHKFDFGGHHDETISFLTLVYYKNCLLNCSVPEDGYYMFTLVVRDIGRTWAAGTVQRISATDPNDITMLCAAEDGGDAYDTTGSCTVRTVVIIYGL